MQHLTVQFAASRRVDLDEDLPVGQPDAVPGLHVLEQPLIIHLEAPGVAGGLADAQHDRRILLEHRAAAGQRGDADLRPRQVGQHAELALFFAGDAADALVEVE